MRAYLIKTLVLVFPLAAMAQTGALQIKILEGEGAAHPPGAHVSHPLTVQVTDDTGRPVPGAAVSFQLPPEGPSGLFSDGLRTDLVITDANGRATIHSVQLNRTGGRVSLRITAAKGQARAGMISYLYIGESRAATAATSAGAAPAAQAPAARRPAANGPAPSGEITPTTPQMAPHSHKKWFVLAAIAAGGAMAFVGVSHAAGGHGSTVSSSVVSIGTPGITIGQP